MNTPRILLLAIAAFAAPALAQSTTPAPAAGEALATLRDAGYAEVREIEFDDGLWEAEVRRANGRWGEVALDPATGEVFDPMADRPMLPLADVLASIEAAGYQSVHDVDRDGALWDADALDAQGQPVELRISAFDGRIVSVHPDLED
ncbi:PepSY domain-containing protein [Arenimonas caeni]|jgi:hypothetical protein|uniref:PepSY domain-containing protein n=1 Tax=Arenimonas caeni TaxID=2058085 RepID=UPI002A36E3D1|nr:PepSY domain-containing protein [Arenimonas caeni]MDY0022048.1 PepSY domain-containing protein [Arenimonas caeni]